MKAEPKANTVTPKPNYAKEYVGRYRALKILGSRSMGSVLAHFELVQVCVSKRVLAIAAKQKYVLQRLFLHGGTGVNLAGALTEVVS